MPDYREAEKFRRSGKKRILISRHAEFALVAQGEHKHLIPDRVIAIERDIGA